MTDIQHNGLITGPADLLAKLPSSAFKVSSWDNTHSPKSQQATYRALGEGVRAESVFDAAHGRRYMLFVYRTREERKACWNRHTGAA